MCINNIINCILGGCFQDQSGLWSVSDKVPDKEETTRVNMRLWLQYKVTPDIHLKKGVGHRCAVLKRCIICHYGPMSSCGSFCKLHGNQR